MADEPAKERQEIDPVFKQVVEAEFTAYQAACQTEYEVNRLPRKIDAFVTVDDETALQKIRQETPFFYLLRHSQLEFKGRRDRLTKAGAFPVGNDRTQWVRPTLFEVLWSFCATTSRFRPLI